MDDRIFSIDFTSKEHQNIKSLALGSGLTVKDYILRLAQEESVGVKVNSLEGLREFLLARVSDVEKGDFSELTFDEIIAEAKEDFAASRN